MMRLWSGKTRIRIVRRSDSVVGSLVSRFVGSLISSFINGPFGILVSSPIGNPISNPISKQAALFLAAAVASATALAQDTVRTLELPTNQALDSNIEYDSEFEFARMYFNSGFEWPRWRADYPHAEFHFSNGLRRLTRIDVSKTSRILRLDDDSLFDYPWLYVVEVGFWSPSSTDIDLLREYLERGGFLMIDDFHGVREWAQFSSVIGKLFPDRELVALGPESVLYDIHFDIDERLQIPGIRSVMNNQTWQKGGVTPGWFGILDDQGRVMVVINFNQDIGDAWEHADDAVYPEKFTSLAYRMGVNYVVYAMTH